MEETLNFQGNCLYKTNIDYSLSQKEKDHITNLKYRRFENPGLFLSKDLNVLDNFLFSNLAKVFNKCVTHYIKNILEIDHDLKLLNSWVTINKKGSFHDPHYHPNTFISVGFYPQIKDGGITFLTQKDPFMNKTNLQLNIINKNLFNSSNVSFKLSSKDLIIFPGWLAHYGHPNPYNIDRIMVGANYFISGNIGSPENINELNLL